MGDDYFNPWDGWHSEYTQKDWDKVNERLKTTPEPYTEPERHTPRRGSVPRFSEWYRLPETKRPPQIEGKRERIYNVSAMYRNEFIDGTGAYVRQLKATINGRNIIVNEYDNGDYVVSNGRHAREAHEGNLDDVIDGFVT